MINLAIFVAVLAVVVVILWLVNVRMAMQPRTRLLLNIAVGLLLVLWIAYAVFGAGLVSVIWIGG